MIIDSYDINSEPIVKLENFYGEKQHLVKKCMVIFSTPIFTTILQRFRTIFRSFISYLYSHIQ